MLGELTAEQFAEWAEYATLEPWGEVRADLRAGIVAAVTANVWRSKSTPAKPSDFMPTFDGRGERRQDADEMRLKAQAWAAAFNGNTPNPSTAKT